MPEPDSMARWQLTAEAKSERAPAPTADEQQVIQLFDELRSRLLRYLAGLRSSAARRRGSDSRSVPGSLPASAARKVAENLRGWVFRVAHNLGLKRRLASAREAAHLSVSQEALDAAWPDPAENPEQQLLTSQRQQRLQAVLRALPEQDRCCLALRAEGLRYREIAEVLDMSLASVSASLTRSLARFSRAGIT